jgi:hypothetical protein
MKRRIAQRRPSLTDRFSLNEKPAGSPGGFFIRSCSSRSVAGSAPAPVISLEEPGWRRVDPCARDYPIRYFGLGSVRIFTRWVMRGLAFAARSETFIFSAFSKVIPG